MVKFKTIEISQISIPFRFHYSHARASHNSVNSVICKITDTNGNTGFGEGVPREYVTGETCESVISSIKRIASKFLYIDLEFNQFKELILSMAEERGQHCFPSCAFCAFEGAALDLFGKIASLPIALLFCKKGKNPLVYTGSIGIDILPLIGVKALVYRGMGFRHFKIKVGDACDIERVRKVKMLFGKQNGFYADANGAWEKEVAIRKIEQLWELGIEAIEEPLRSKNTVKRIDGQANRELVLDKQHYQQYQWLRDRSPIPIIADESFISPESYNKIVTTSSFDIINIRLSKCGGFIIGSEIIKKAEQHNISYGIGAMIAETPILANEGAQFGYVHGMHRYIQGFSHKVLHKKQFAHGGAKLKKGAIVNLELNQPGNGLAIDNQTLNKVTTRRETIE